MTNFSISFFFALHFYAGSRKGECFLYWYTPKFLGVGAFVSFPINIMYKSWFWIWTRLYLYYDLIGWFAYANSVIIMRWKQHRLNIDSSRTIIFSNHMSFRTVWWIIQFSIRMMLAEGNFSVTGWMDDGGMQSLRWMIIWDILTKWYKMHLLAIWWC